MCDGASLATGLNVAATVAAAIAAGFATRAAYKSSNAADKANITNEKALDVTLRASVTAQQTLTFEALSELHKVYASPEMNDSLSLVHRFKKTMNLAKDPTPPGPDRIQQRFLNLLENLEKDEVDKSSPNYDAARRQVSHFFQRMAVIRETQILKDGQLFLGWGKSTFKVIGDVIIPMEKAKGQHINENPAETITRLEALQKAAEDNYDSRLKK